MKKLLSILFLLVLITSADTCSYSSEFEKQMEIVIDIPSRQLSFFNNSELIKTYPVAVGKPNSQTPTGEFKIINKIINPYYSRMNIPGGSPNNPLGSRWIGFKHLYGIHGNSNPKSIGTFASGGCVRMFEKDVQELYEIVSEGTTVSILYNILKIHKDVDGLNPVLIAYPDYYLKESNIIDKLDTKLEELGLLKRIPNEKLQRLKQLMNKTQVVFSDEWTYFINGNYVTNDIIDNDGELFVNAEKISKFFNAQVLKVQNQKHVKILDMTVPAIQIDTTSYISLDNIEKALGGSHTIDNTMDRVDYKLNYVLLNNKLIPGELLNVEDNPQIMLKPLISALNLKVDIKKDDTNIIFNNKKVEYSIINEEAYVDVNELEKLLNAKTEMFSLDNHIEIFSEPDIIYNNIIFKGKMTSKEIFVPYSMLEVAASDISSQIKYSIELNGLEYVSINNEKYVSMSHLLYYFNIENDLYKTKIYIKLKTLL